MKDRLERAIAHQGLASRREAKALIVARAVSVNGTVVIEPGFAVDTERDTIDVAGLAPKESVLVYKPRGVETTTTSSGTRDLHKILPTLKHLSPIGRLDKDSEGLIIMSNDGTLTKALTGEDSHVGKTYLVTVRENIPDAALERMRTGIKLDRVMTKPAKVSRKSRVSFLVTLYEGRKHQIRRMCDACKLTIESLVRVGIGHIEIGAMKSGQVKKLTSQDIAQLKH